MSTKKYTCTLLAAFLRILTAEPGCLNQVGYSPFVLFYPMFIMPGLCVPGFFLPRRGLPQWQRLIPSITVDSTIIEFSCSELTVIVLSRLKHTKRNDFSTVPTPCGSRYRASSFSVHTFTLVM